MRSLRPVAFALAALVTTGCATTEDAVDRHTPGGLPDASGDSSDASATTDGEPEASTDADAGPAEAAPEASDAADGGAPDAAADSGDASASDAGGDEGDAGDGDGWVPPDASDASDAPEPSDADAGDAPVDVGPLGDCGCTGDTLVLVAGGSALIEAEQTSGTWAVHATTQATQSAPAIAATGPGAVVVVRDGSDGLRYSTWSAGTGGLAPFADVGTFGFTIGTPALAVFGDVQLVFVGTDNKLYSNTYVLGSGWKTTTFPPVGTSFGPGAPSAAGVAAGLVIAFEGSDGYVYDQTWNGGWAAAHQQAGQTFAPPTIARMYGGSVDAIVAFLEKTSHQVMWSQRAAGLWSTPAGIGNAFSDQAASLTGISGGNAILAFRGQDGSAYASYYSASSFGPVASVAPGLAITAPPAVSRGLPGHTAEIALPTATGVYHASLAAGVWSTPELVQAGTFTSVALTAWP